MPLTPAELRVVELLAEAEQAFATLPERMASDNEFAVFVHALQHRVMARAALREHVETFAGLTTTLPDTPSRPAPVIEADDKLMTTDERGATSPFTRRRAVVEVDAAEHGKPGWA